MRVLRALIIVLAISVIAIVRVGPEAEADQVYTAHFDAATDQARDWAGPSIAASIAAPGHRAEHICHSGKRIVPTVLSTAEPDAPHQQKFLARGPHWRAPVSTDFPTPPPRAVLQA